MEVTRVAPSRRRGSPRRPLRCDLPRARIVNGMAFTSRARSYPCRRWWIRPRQRPSTVPVDRGHVTLTPRPPAHTPPHLSSKSVRLGVTVTASVNGLIDLFRNRARISVRRLPVVCGSDLSGSRRVENWPPIDHATPRQRPERREVRRHERTRKSEPSAVGPSRPRRGNQLRPALGQILPDALVTSRGRSTGAAIVGSARLRGYRCSRCHRSPPERRRRGVAVAFSGAVTPVVSERRRAGAPGWGAPRRPPRREGQAVQRSVDVGERAEEKKRRPCRCSLSLRESSVPPSGARS